MGDPADLVGMIDKSLESDPDNVDLWFGRGRVFYKLKNYDETINSFKKVVELKPDLYEGNYYLGLFYTVKADAMNTEMGQKNYRSQSEYDADLKEVNVVYMAALPYFEKAHQAQTRRRGYGRLHQVDHLPSARRTGYDGQVQRVQ